MTKLTRTLVCLALIIVVLSPPAYAYPYVHMEDAQNYFNR